MQMKYLLCALAALSMHIDLAAKKVFFLNATDDDIEVKGPFEKGTRYLSSERIQQEDVEVVDFQASDSQNLYIRYLTGSRHSRDPRVAGEFMTKFPENNTVILFTKSQKEVEIDGEKQMVPEYHAWVSVKFNEAKTRLPKAF